MVGDAGVGGGGLGICRCRFCGAAASVPSVSMPAAGASSFQDSDGAIASGFVRILGACASGVMASLSSVEASAAADVEVMSGAI